MYNSNLANRAMRQAEVGHVWEEKLTNAQGSLELTEYQTFRVRATGATTVTIDGVLAMTMATGEIALFCAGKGNPTDNKPTVTVTIGVANAFVQVARVQDRQS